MTSNRGAGVKRMPVTPPRKPLWRRLNRHALFVLHVILYVVVGTWIWTLNAPSLDKQFDVLFWLTLISAHGLVVYRNQRFAFVLHLLMFSAGNGTIWSTTAATADKLTVTLGWVFVAGLVGLWLARRQLTAKPLPPAAPAQRKPRGRKAPPAPPEPEWYEPPASAGWDESSAEVEWYESPDDQSGDSAEIEPPPKKRGRKKNGGA